MSGEGRRWFLESGLSLDRLADGALPECLLEGRDGLLDIRVLEYRLHDSVRESRDKAGQAVAGGRAAQSRVEGEVFHEPDYPQWASADRSDEEEVDVGLFILILEKAGEEDELDLFRHVGHACRVLAEEGDGFVHGQGVAGGEVDRLWRRESSRKHPNLHLLWQLD